MIKTALIIGAGPGISGAFAIKLANEGYSLCLACRNTDKLKDLSAKISASTFKTDCSKEENILHLFDYLMRILAPQIWFYITVGVGSVEKFMSLIGFRLQTRLKLILMVLLQWLRKLQSE